MRDTSPILLMVTPEDMNYLHLIKPLLQGRKAFAIDQEPDTIAEVELYAKSQKIKYIISTSTSVLNKVIQSQTHQNIDNWAGSIYERGGITYLFLNRLKQFYTVPYGRFLAKRFISKIISPEEWDLTPEFSWELLTPETVDRWYELFQRALCIAEDIETKSFEYPAEELNTAIRCICYTGLWEDGNIHTVVIPILEAEEEHQTYWLYWMRKFNELKVPKIFQNGLYDNAHLICYASPNWGYFWDTQSLFHSWYCELPKRLDFITAFCVHNSFYWKDLAHEGGKNKLFEYNARDGWATMVSWLYLLKNLPDWAWTNYLIKFPIWIPCLVCNLEGWKVDGNRRAELATKYIKDYEVSIARLRTWFGSEFNPRSPQQVVKLMAFYGSGDIGSSDESSLRTFSIRHPLNARFASEILATRETGGILTKYIKPPNYSVTAKPSKRKTYLLKSGRLFYSLNPDGTDTTRLSCSEGFTWTGVQIQNQPEKALEIREMYIADDGFMVGEVDGEQAEARGVAYLSGDKNLLEVVNSGKDYHALNAERFFGVPYDEIVRWIDGHWEVINRELRNLSKRTNHGSNYNMGWYMLLITMGEIAVDKAKGLLKLPPYWTRQRVCEHLLNCYMEAYPTVKKDYYQYIIANVQTNKKLTSALGWTRYCFGNPAHSKPDLNALVAHPSQNLIVMIINEGFKDVYHQIQRKYPRDFRLKAQVHDSIPFQFRIGCEELVTRARKICTREVEVKDCHGISRKMIIPMSAKTGINWGQMKLFKESLT